MKPKLLVLAASLLLVSGYLGVDRLLGAPDRPRVLARTDDGNRHSVTLLSATYRLDRLYPSMTGPYGNLGNLTLLGKGDDRRVWVTGIRTEAVDRSGTHPVSPEFFCHANLTLAERGNSPALHNALFDDRTHLDWRLFTLVPGRMEVRLPEGFGIPALASEPLDFLSMSLNLNVPDREVDVRFRTRIDFVTATGDTPPVKPLFRRALYGYETVSGDGETMACAEPMHPGASCGPVLGLAASEKGFVESLGKTKAIHWMVAPGRYTLHTDVTPQMDLPMDTTVHYVTAHLHPYGVSLTLIDRTTADTLFVLRSKDFENKIGVERMEELELPEGVPVYRDHAYELVTDYDNRTEGNVDAMAILYLYLADKDLPPGLAAANPGE